MRKTQRIAAIVGVNFLILVTIHAQLELGTRMVAAANEKGSVRESGFTIPWFTTRDALPPVFV